MMQGQREEYIPLSIKQWILILCRCIKSRRKHIALFVLPPDKGFLPTKAEKGNSHGLLCATGRVKSVVCSSLNWYFDEAASLVDPLIDD